MTADCDISPASFAVVDDLDRIYAERGTKTDEGGWHRFGNMTERATRFDDSTVDALGRLT
jgi:hypothetical protein